MDFWSNVAAELLAGSILLLFTALGFVCRWFSKQKIKVEIAFEANADSK